MRCGKMGACLGNTNTDGYRNIALRAFVAAAALAATVILGTVVVAQVHLVFGNHLP